MNFRLSGDILGPCKDDLTSEVVDGGNREVSIEGSEIEGPSFSLREGDPIHVEVIFRFIGAGNFEVGGSEEFRGKLEVGFLAEVEGCGFEVGEVVSVHVFTLSRGMKVFMRKLNFFRWDLVTVCDRLSDRMDCPMDEFRKVARRSPGGRKEGFWVRARGSPAGRRR